MIKENIIEYITLCIGVFANSFGISNFRAYQYLKRYKAIRFLIDYYEIESLATELTLMLMEDKHLSMEEALDTVYNSHTFRLIEDEKTGLYYQGPVYVMEYLKEELNKNTQG